jgi:hypothetical protein
MLALFCTLGFSPFLISTINLKYQKGEEDRHIYFQTQGCLNRKFSRPKDVLGFSFKKISRIGLEVYWCIFTELAHLENDNQ